MPREELLQIRLSESEKERIEKKSARANFPTPASWARKVLLDEADKPD